MLAMSSRSASQLFGGWKNKANVEQFRLYICDGELRSMLSENLDDAIRS